MIEGVFTEKLVENVVAKGDLELLVLSNFFSCHNVFKSRLLQRRQKPSVRGKGLNATDQLVRLSSDRKKISIHSIIALGRV